MIAMKHINTWCNKINDKKGESKWMNRNSDNLKNSKDKQHVDQKLTGISNSVF